MKGYVIFDGILRYYINKIEIVYHRYESKRYSFFLSFLDIIDLLFLIKTIYLRTTHRISISKAVLSHDTR